jgi:hypothetical protein
MTIAEAMVYCTGICCGAPVVVVLILVVSSCFITRNLP